MAVTRHQRTQFPFDINRKPPSNARAHGADNPPSLLNAAEWLKADGLVIRLPAYRKLAQLAADSASVLADLQMLAMVLAGGVPVGTTTPQRRVAAHARRVSRLAGCGVAVAGAGEHGEGLTPLSLAAAFNRTDMVRWLLDHGASRDMRDAAGNRAVDVAHTLGAIDTARILGDERYWRSRLPLPIAVAHCPIAVAHCPSRLPIVHRDCPLPIAVAHCRSRLPIVHRDCPLPIAIAHCRSRLPIADLDYPLPMCLPLQIVDSPIAD